MSEKTLPATRPNTSPAAAISGGAFSMVPRNFDELIRFSEFISKSNLCPVAFRGKPADVALVLQLGQEVGVSAIQALQNICVINGRPCMWGDLVVALVKASPHLEYGPLESWDPKTETATVRIKRRGHPECVRTFSMADARKAKLDKKDTYQQWGPRMCGWRAKTFGIRDEFPDILKGLTTREEAMDLPPIETTFTVLTSGAESAKQEEPPDSAKSQSTEEWARDYEDAPEPPQAPAAEGEQPTLPSNPDQLFVLNAYKGGTGTNKKGNPYTWYVVELSDGSKPTTFSETDFHNAQVAAREKIPVVVETEPGKKEGQLNLKSLEKA